MDTLLASAPLSYRQIMWRSIKLYKISFLRVILLCFLMSLIVFIPRLLSVVIGQDIYLHLEFLNWHRAWAFVIEFASLIFFIGIIWRMHCILIGKHERLLEDFTVALHKVVAVFVAGLIGSLLVVGVGAAVVGLQILLSNQQILFSTHLLGMIVTICVFILQMLLILYSVTLFIFLVPLIAIENKHVFAALEKSLVLAWNHWWRIFSVQFTPWFTYLILLVILRYLLHINIHIYFVEQSQHTLLTSILHIVLFTLYLPWVAALLIIQLNDLEVRNKLKKAA